MNENRQATLDKLRRYRAERHQPVGSEQMLFHEQKAYIVEDGKFTPTPFHDILMITAYDAQGPKECYRVPVTRTAEGIASGHPPGTYVHAPELMDPYDYAQRKVNTASRPHDWSRGPTEAHNQERGPAFATLPVKPEPAATSCAICFLINAKNLRFSNAWTAEEWSAPGEEDLPADPLVMQDSFEAILAGPQGKVFRINVHNLGNWQPGNMHRVEFRSAAPSSGYGRTTKTAAIIECLDLQPQVEVWNQLRNGCVAGRVLLNAGEDSRVVPLVNITTLTTAKTPQPGRSSAPAPRNPSTENQS